jgi:hypothetical protein
MAPFSQDYWRGLEGLRAPAARSEILRARAASEHSGADTPLMIERETGGESQEKPFKSRQP